MGSAFGESFSHSEHRRLWLFAALAGVLMHSFVDFDMPIPAIPALFCVLAAQPLRKRREAPAGETEGDAEDSIAPHERPLPVFAEA